MFIDREQNLRFIFRIFYTVSVQCRIVPAPSSKADRALTRSVLFTYRRAAVPRLYEHDLLF